MEGLALTAGDVNLLGSNDCCRLGVVEVRGSGGRNEARDGRSAADWLLRSGTETDDFSGSFDADVTGTGERGLARRGFLSVGWVSEGSELEALRLDKPFEIMC